MLLIDDEQVIHDYFRCIFHQSEAKLVSARTAAEGIERFSRAGADVVFLDVGLPDQSGLDAFRRIREIDPGVPVVIITGSGTAGTAMEAMSSGASEFLPKPFSQESLRELLSCIAAAPRSPTAVPSIAEVSDSLVGRSESMTSVYKAVGRVAPHGTTVLVSGESGTGKELVARAIHQYSRRAAGPFLAINCAAVPEALLESELFGHEKGAFTGADRRRVGKFEQAHGGTLFLDEIGDMSPQTQAKVLRVLQEQAFERVGGGETVRTDVRLIAATHRDLEAMVADGRFRQDLYFRLNVYTVRLPPLRDRGADIPLLVDHFVSRFSREFAKEVRAVSPEAMELLQHYPWPGNVRELQSVLKQAILHSIGPILYPGSLPANVRAYSDNKSVVATGSGPADSPLPELSRFIQARLGAGVTGLHAELQGLTERVLLTEVLRFTGGNQSQAARLLGISRPTVRARLAALEARRE